MNAMNTTSFLNKHFRQYHLPGSGRSLHTPCFLLSFYVFFFYTCLPPILWHVSQYLFFYLFYCLICLFHICLPEVLWRVSQYLLFCLFCCLNNTTQHLPPPPPQPTHTQVNSVYEYKCETYILWDIYYVIQIYILGTVRTSFVTSVYNETVKL